MPGILLVIGRIIPIESQLFIESSENDARTSRLESTSNEKSSIETAKNILFYFINSPNSQECGRGMVRERDLCEGDFFSYSLDTKFSMDTSLGISQRFCYHFYYNKSCNYC